MGCQAGIIVLTVAPLRRFPHLAMKVRRLQVLSLFPLPYVQCGLSPSTLAKDTRTCKVALSTCRIAAVLFLCPWACARRATMPMLLCPDSKCGFCCCSECLNILLAVIGYPPFPLSCRSNHRLRNLSGVFCGCSMGLVSLPENRLVPTYSRSLEQSHNILLASLKGESDDSML